MNKTKIEWCDYSWNPIKGLCPEACWYCYARAMDKRFKRNPALWLSFPYEDLNKLSLVERKGGARVFVCSTMEMFHPVVPEEWRIGIFNIIRACPKTTFIVLTKHPELATREIPENVWFGVTATGIEDWWRVRELSKIKAKVKFVSLEPLLGIAPVIVTERDFDWLIVGRLTGHGRHRDPSGGSINSIVRVAQGFGIPIFLKDNLKDIWPGPLIQEFPK